MLALASQDLVEFTVHFYCLFETIAIAKLSRSAKKDQEFGLPQSDDSIMAKGDRLLTNLNAYKGVHTRSAEYCSLALPDKISGWFFLDSGYKATGFVTSCLTGYIFCMEASTSL